MNRIRQAKRCPHCGTMTRTETPICATCGHLFRSDLEATPPSFNPERTQMLTLPPNPSQSTRTEQVALHEPVSYIEPIAPRRRSKTPLIAMLISVMIVLIAVFCWVVR